MSPKRYGIETAFPACLFIADSVHPVFLLGTPSGETGYFVSNGDVEFSGIEDGGGII
jgi:hypothetical protein